MKRFFVVACLCVFGALSASAQKADISALDRSARSNGKQSVLFQAQEMMAQQAQEQARLEEQKRRMEEERRKALRPVNLFGNEYKIFAEVNGEIITSRDMQNRVNAFVATTQIPVTAQTKEMIIQKVLQAAIDEKLKLQEAKKNGVEISEADLNDGMKNFASSNKISVSKLRQTLRETGVDEAVFRAQMKAEMAWSRLVMMKYRRLGEVSEAEIQKAVDLVNQDKTKQKYLISEIVVDKKKAKNIQDLVENLRKDPRFELYAMQFSESPTAKSGGNLGWVSLNQLAEPLANVVSKMKKGAVSSPISVGSDFYILKLEKIYRPGIDTPPSTNPDEIRELLRSKKLEEIANKYIRDLRQQAVIELRV